MARRAISYDDYQKLIDAFRATPGQPAVASRAVVMDVRTARKAWEVGLPHLGSWARPIKAIFEEEKVRARAILAETKVGEAKVQVLGIADRAKEDAASARAGEAAVVRTARLNALGLLAATNRMVAAVVNKFSPRFEGLLDALLPKLDPNTGEAIDVKPEHAERIMKVLLRLSAIVRQGHEASLTALQMERLLLGEPTSILGITVPDLSPQEYIQHVQAANKTLERAARIGLVALPPAPPASGGDGTGNGSSGAAA